MLHKFDQWVSDRANFAVSGPTSLIEELKNDAEFWKKEGPSIQKSVQSAGLNILNLIEYCLT